MILKKLSFLKPEIDGGQNILPSAFPFYGKNEIEEIFALTPTQRVERLARDLGLTPDGEEGITVAADENLFFSDISRGGEVEAGFSEGISPSVASSIVGSLGEMELDGEGVILCVPCDDGLLASAFAVKAMGFPVSGIAVPFVEDTDGPNVSLVDISGESISEYIRDFYEDFDVLLGLSDARACLCADIITEGFNEKVLVLSAFGYNETPLECCQALSGKRINDKDLARWLENNCALSLPAKKNSRQISQIEKKSMKELCNILNGVKVY